MILFFESLMKNISNPKVSVVMAVYNSEKYINMSINSIVNQTYKNWEFIIINDHSNDATEDILNNYKSRKIKVLNLKKNIGSYRCLDLGFKLCAGKYIAILDSDDISHKNRLKAQVAELEKDENTGLVATWYKVINENNKIINFVKMPENNKFNIIFPCQNLICNSSTMFRRKIFKELKFYNKNIFYSYDYKFYLEIFKKYKIKIIKNFYTSYRIHSRQRTKSKELKKIICRESIIHLKWSKNNFLINRFNFFLFYKMYLKNFIKLLIS
jgi:glycosyltransferase involved in cell wall biosynthesis